MAQLIMRQLVKLSGVKGTGGPGNKNYPIVYYQDPTAAPFPIENIGAIPFSDVVSPIMGYASWSFDKSALILDISDWNDHPEYEYYIEAGVNITLMTYRLPGVVGHPTAPPEPQGFGGVVSVDYGQWSGRMNVIQANACTTNDTGMIYDDTLIITHDVHARPIAQSKEYASAAACFEDLSNVPNIVNRGAVRLIKSKRRLAYLCSKLVVAVRAVSDSTMNYDPAPPRTMDSFVRPDSSAYIYIEKYIP